MTGPPVSHEPLSHCRCISAFDLRNCFAGDHEDSRPRMVEQDDPNLGITRLLLRVPRSTPASRSSPKEPTHG